MKHDTASYSNHPYRESVNLINIFNLSSEDCLKDLVSHKQSGNPTFSLHKEILPDTSSFNDIHPHFDDDPLSGSTTYSTNLLLKEFADELAFITYPLDYDDNLECDIESDIREIEFLHFQGEDSNFQDSINQSVLTHFDVYLLIPHQRCSLMNNLLIIHFHRDLMCILMISWKLSPMLLLMMILLTSRGRKSKRLNS
nr:hypothetical protein [Tanacetum cinerariifolium]GEZ62133.1 hypothetical protein [Tanacetum cinerariifolium]